jgi:hypothetical protein
MNVEEPCKKRGWNVPKWLQMSRKEVLWSFVIVTVIGGAIASIAGTLILDWFKSPPSIPQQIRELHNPSPPFTTHFWIDAPGKTVFYQNDRVTLFYKVTNFRKDKPLYFTLLNISPQGIVNQLLSQKEIKAGQEYTSPEQLPAENLVQLDTQPQIIDTQRFDTQRLGLETVGQEYFKVIVTSKRIDWEEFLKRIQEKVQPVSLWATSELTVDVKPISKNQ